jgi:hypothetical protein
MNETGTVDTAAGKVAAIAALADEVDDPVFRRSLKEIAASMQLALEFKRMDMAFLQMRGAGSLPKFAVQFFDRFVRGEAIVLTQGGGYLLKDEANRDCNRFGEFFVRGDYFNDQQATPKHVVPETIAAIVEGVRDRFDEVFVAWEADWQPRDGDPLVIGRKGAYYYLIAAWDMTKLESFVAGTFAG